MVYYINAGFIRSTKLYVYAYSRIYAYSLILTMIIYGVEQQQCLYGLYLYIWRGSIYGLY